MPKYLPLDIKDTDSILIRRKDTDRILKIPMNLEVPVQRFQSDSKDSKIPIRGYFREGPNCAFTPKVLANQAFTPKFWAITPSLAITP